jgi:malate dehydrogenase (oxaloacetate-decarboxylating)
MKDVRVVVLGVGAAGVAISKLLLKEGVGDVIGVNRSGIIDESDTRLDVDRRWLAANTNKEKRKGSLSDAMTDADVFIGVSGSNLVSEEQLKLMADNSIVFALANPDPEVDPVIARRHAAVVATGRSDEPNQINNVLVFPGIFRGMLNAGAKQVTEEIEIAAGRAIADVVTPGELSADYIVPTVFNPLVVTAVTNAVERLVTQSH